MRRNVYLRTIAAALCAAVFAMSAHAAEKVYKWVDADGVVHYGKQPPPAAETEAISVQKGYTKSAEDEPAELTEEEKIAQQEAGYCSTAKQNLAALQGDREVRQTDEYGNVTVLTEEQKAEQRARAQTAIDRYCKPEKAAPAP